MYNDHVTMHNENLGAILNGMGFSPRMISNHLPESGFNFEVNRSIPRLIYCPPPPKNTIEKLVKATDESNAAKEGRVYISPEKRVKLATARRAN